MRGVILVLALVVGLFATAPAFADTITVSVKGMVCSFCAQGIKKTFMRKDGVESVDVDLDKKLVTIRTKAGSAISDADVKESIVDAGYEVVTIERAS